MKRVRFYPSQRNHPFELVADEQSLMYKDATVQFSHCVHEYKQDDNIPPPFYRFPNSHTDRCGRLRSFKCIQVSLYSIYAT